MADEVARTNKEPDDLVKALVASPEAITDIVVLHGWLGKDRDRDSLRLYLTPHLNDYVIIPADKIVGRFRTEDGEKHSYVAVSRQAWLRRVQLEAQGVQTSFLAGELAHGQPPQGTALEPPRLGYHASHLC
jgi:hypothetical protein